MQLAALLQRWNKAYNLTAITATDEIIAKHLLDSLSVHPYLEGNAILDVGTGGGFPGLPLALLHPDRAFTLLDSHAKKLRFVRTAAAELGLKNVTTVHARVEQWQPDQRFSTITCRAFSALENIVHWCGHLLSTDGHIQAMKGHVEPAELTALPAGWGATVRPVVVPFVDGARHIVTLTPD
ncbi:MAG: 16S rRNA (guanine(527)-N(7))-methyltransferase RsmG [Pseudomonadota bacterium]